MGKRFLPLTLQIDEYRERCAQATQRGEEYKVKIRKIKEYKVKIKKIRRNEEYKVKILS